MYPSVFIKFMNGNMSGSKNNRRFSGVVHDQLHEQNDKLVKDTSNNLSRFNQGKSLMQWMFNGPEVARMIGEPEEHQNLKSGIASENHHGHPARFSHRF